MTGDATHEDAASEIDYAAHVKMSEAGLWDGTITISGPAGDCQVAFTQRVLAQRGFSTVILIGLPFLAIVAVMAGYWLLRPRAGVSAQSRRESDTGGGR